MRFSPRSLVSSMLALMVIPALCLALFVSIRGAAHASTSTSLQLSRKSGPPTTVLAVNGVGYGVNELVTIDFNARQVSAAPSTSSGTFSASIKIPAAALPGLYEVKAIGQTSGHSAQSAFRVQTDWTMFGFNHQHTRSNPYENVLTPANVHGLTLNWSYTTGNLVDSSPAVANGVVYIGSDDNKFYALDATTGALKWSYATGNLVYTSPAVVNGVVYFGTDNQFYALDATTGVLKWSYTTVPYVTSPAVANGVVYFGSGKLYALDATTGALKWSYSTGTYLVDSSPAVANGVVYFDSENKLHALDATTGALKWSYATGFVDSSPAVANGVVYIGSHDYKLYAFHLPSTAA